MKTIFKNYLQNEIDAKKALLDSNSLAEEDRELISSAVDNLNGIMEELDADGTEADLDELRASIETLNDSISAIQEKLTQNKQEINQETETMEMNYLKTQNSVHDFAEAIRNSRTADEFRANWRDTLSKNDVNPDSITITEGSEDAFVPDAVKGMINDIWDRNADWLKDLNYTGAKRFYVRHNVSDQTDETSRAKGWKKGATKVRQDLEFSAKLLEGQFIYKIAEIDLKTKFDDDNSLLTYVINELTDQILYEIKRAILVGDGRQNNDTYKISSFETLAKTTQDAYTLVSTVASDFLVDDMRAMVDGIVNPNGKPVYVFMSKADLRTLARVQASETSTPVYMSNEQVAEQIGADRIITTDLLGDDYKAVAFIPSEYFMVGAPNLLSPILYTWHEGYKNLDVYRNETVAGGGINAMLSSAVLLPGE